MYFPFSWICSRSKAEGCQRSTNQVGAKILLKGTTNPENWRRKSCWASYRM
ncbi:hypothetical protein ACS0TY_006278 [Phlomoides rotata]